MAYKLLQCRCKVPACKETWIKMFVSVWRFIGHPPSFWNLLPQSMPVRCHSASDFFHAEELYPRSQCRVSRARTQWSRVVCRLSAHSHSRSQVCSYTSSNAAQLCICLQAVLTGPWLLVSYCRSARSWSQATFEVRPGVDTNSKAGGATHGRFCAWHHSTSTIRFVQPDASRSKPPRSRLW